MADLAKSMARALRDVGFVSESAQLEVGSAEDFAWVVRPPHVAERAVFGGVQHEQFRGLVADRSGAVGVFKALPADNMGTLLDRQSLQADMAEVFALAVAHLGECEWVAVAAGLVNPWNVYEGNPAQMGTRNRSFMRSPTEAPVRVGGDFMMPGVQIAAAFGDIGADLAHEILVALGRLR
jgi:hypothetical protein